MIKGKFLLGSEDISIPLSIRKEVFEEELGLAGMGGDQNDAAAFHGLLFDDDVPVAASRIFFNGEDFELDCICVKKEYRGQLIGDLMARVTILKASDFAETMVLHSFLDTADFFKKYGFKETDKRDTIGGYPAVWMTLHQSDIKLAGTCGGCKDCHGCKQGG